MSSGSIPSFRGADRETILGTLAAAREFLKTIAPDIGPMYELFVNRTWESVIDEAAIRDCEDDESLAAQLRPVMSFLGLFRDILRFHALTDDDMPEDPGGETPAAAIYRDLLSWSAFTAAGVETYFSIFAMKSPQKLANIFHDTLKINLTLNDFKTDGAGRKYGILQQKQAYLRSREAARVPRAAWHNSKRRGEIREQLAKEFEPPAMRELADAMLDQLYANSQSGMADATEKIFYENPGAGLIAQAALDYLLRLDEKENDAQFKTAMKVYRAKFDAKPEHQLENPERLMKTFNIASEPLVRRGDVSMGSALPHVRTSMESYTDFDTLLQLYESADDPEKYFFQIFFKATEKGAAGIAAALGRNVYENLTGRMFSAPPLLLPPPA